MTFFDQAWAGLDWSGFVPFSDGTSDFKRITNKPGLYRIRPVGREFLMYIGETGRSLRQRLNELRINTLKPEMPWNDPHTAAPSLWAWHDAERYQYECSVAPFEGEKRIRRGMECFLLYDYRCLSGTSTLCNFGRFHPRYRKSTNRNKGLRGGKIRDEMDPNPAGGECFPPLTSGGKPGNENWMGLSFSGTTRLNSEGLKTTPTLPGVYTLIDDVSGEIIYLGESLNLKNRLKQHSSYEWEGRKVVFAFHSFNQGIQKFNLKEIENDLIGSYFELVGDVPVYQFGNELRY